MNRLQSVAGRPKSIGPPPTGVASMPQTPARAKKIGTGLSRNWKRKQRGWRLWLLAVSG